ncbi:MAG: 30S ribosome-binding factor RbfA [Bacteroidaceae bacterium]|nr:30S ribosome-binding factor RbfA [Bacteroidaceae bacterium]
MDNTRQQKISRLVQKELSEMFLKQTKLTKGLLVSVSGVRISSDLQIANVYLSVFPSEKAVETVRNVNENVKSLRFDFGQRVRHQLRVIPDFRFFVDDSLDYVEHIDELLKK